MRIFSPIVAFLLVASPALATNRGFMPGDACFHSILTKDRLAALAASEKATVPFIRPKGEQFAFCGYAGYWSLQFPPNSDSLVKNLNALYTELRRYSPRELQEHVNSDGKTVQFETNGFHIVIYNRDFDPLKYNIALRYNETWSEDESSFGPRPRITRLESYVVDRVAFSNDWRDAKDVPPLRATHPSIPDQEPATALLTRWLENDAEPCGEPERLITRVLAVTVVCGSPRRTGLWRRHACALVILMSGTWETWPGWCRDRAWPWMS